MRVAPALLIATVVSATLAACGSSEEATPAACLEGPKTYLSALAAAPGTVELSEGVAIGDCLTQNQPGGDLARVGEAMVEAATTLNAKARAEPGAAANLELGYLVGAAQRGAEDNEGIDTDLVRRLSAAAGYSPDNRPLPPRFLRTYREGFDGGHVKG